MFYLIEYTCLTPCIAFPPCTGTSFSTQGPADVFGPTYYDRPTTHKQCALIPPLKFVIRFIRIRRAITVYHSYTYLLAKTSRTK
ncbi:hypothetical protein THIOM_001543 [Candidatus Thiomargarita nelsonii]|uniref:Uncharacterized protein n=1 Tax=Candidatus Thiomargarita nelsonii TaxID=1003181 RepID=A0A176S3K7_9GAMM|nr:hypothetical protein THIOM_001543 [Candidatus Thiomargarita nelsonii]